MTTIFKWLNGLHILPQMINKSSNFGWKQESQKLPTQLGNGPKRWLRACTQIVLFNTIHCMSYVESLIDV